MELASIIHLKKEGACPSPILHLPYAVTILYGLLSPLPTLEDNQPSEDKRLAGAKDCSYRGVMVELFIQTILRL